MEKGKKLDEAKVKAALTAKKMQFVSLTEVDAPLPKASYTLQATGTG